MKKTKKLLSIFTALTITASAFAGLAIPASAEGEDAPAWEVPEYSAGDAVHSNSSITATDATVTVGGTAYDIKVLGTISGGIDDASSAVYNQQSGGTATFTVTTEAAGDYDVTVTGRGASGRRVDLAVGETVYSFATDTESEYSSYWTVISDASDSRQVFTYTFEDVVLAEGENSIAVGTKVNDTWAPDIVGLDIAAAVPEVMPDGITYKNGKVTVKTDDAAETATLLYAQYYSDGTLESVTSYPLTFTEGIATQALTDVVKGSKLMVWDSLDGMKPVCDAVTLETGSEPNDPPVKPDNPDDPDDPEEPIVVPEDATVYYLDTYNEQNTATVIASVGNEVNDAPADVEFAGTTGKLICSAGRRNNGGIGSPVPSIAITADGKSGNGMTVTSGPYSTSSRGVKFVFDGTPNFADITEGNVLVWSFNAKMSDAECMTVAGMNLGTATQGISATNWVNVQIVFDNDNSKQSVIVTDDNGKLLGTTTTALSGTTIGDVSFYIGTNTVNLDNMAVYQAAAQTFSTTLTVKTDEGTAVDGVTLAIDSATYTTDANGQVTVVLPNGTYAYTASKAGYEATPDQADPATGTVTVDGAAANTDIVLNQQQYTPVPSELTISGGQKAMTAPHALETTESAAYVLTVMDQRNVEITDADIEWTILPTGSEDADPNVTIADGVVSVAKNFTAGDTHVKNFTIIATAAKNGESESATTSIDISDYLFYEPGIGGSSYGTTNTAYLNTGGVNSGTESYIATPAVKDKTEKIVLPDPITFTPGTAELLSFKTTVQNKTGYTFQRTVSLVDSDDTNIIQFGYINLDIGDSATATWSSGTSTFATTWGSIPELNSWIDVTLLFKTNANGVTKVTLTVNGKVTELGETAATGLASINTFLGVNTVDRYALLKDIIVSEVDVTGIAIDGPKEFSTITNQTVTKEYAVDAMVIEDDETFSWTTTIPGATIAASQEDPQKAILTVPGTTTTGGTITLTSSVSTEEKPKTATIDVTVEPAVIASATINGSPTLDKTAGTAAYTVSDVKDQFGDDVTNYFTPVWSLADDDAQIASIDESGVVTINGTGDITVKATFTHGENTYPFTKDVKIGTFSVIDDATGDSTVVDISSLVTDDKITDYQVTTAKSDGTKVNSTTVSKADVVDNKITVDTTGADRVEITPVFEGVIGDVFTVPADRYNITVVAGTGDRTDVYVNDQMVINNLNQGSDNWTVARTKVDNTEYTAGDVIISGGTATFKLYDDRGGTGTAKKIKFAKAPSIVNRAKRVYVIGDSLTAKYYGNAAEGQEGLVRTGWGDVLGDYLADGVEITNLGNSGAWAEGMLNDAFTNVRESGQAGDILVLESGYNDSSHTSMDVMRDSVKAMVKGAEAKGMKVFVVTPNASSHSGNEYIGSVKSTGDMIKAYNELVEEGSSAVLIDLAAKSGFFYKSYYGDATYAGDTPSIPSEVATLLQTYYNNSADSLHSSYNAANCWAAVVANGILTNEDTADVIDTTYEYTFSDGTNNIVVSATKISNPDYAENNINFTEGDVTVTRPNGTAITSAAAGDTVKVVLADASKTLSVAGTNTVTATYNESTKAYYFIMPAEAVTITVTAAEGGDAGNE